jgi:predicted murein hydrolase (TIGR00659 family)
VILTLAVYEAARCFYRRTRWLLAHPVFLTFLVIVALLHGGGIPYARYASGGQIITFFLGPSVVALAVPVYQHRRAIRAQWPGILAGILAGSIASVLAVCSFAHWLGASHQTVLSMAPKSVTMAVALGIAQKTGGIPSITAPVVLFTGIFGGLFGLPILTWFGIRSRLARGLAMGTAAHGLGTARAMEDDSLSGATAGLAIGLTGLATALVLPLILYLLRI